VWASDGHAGSNPKVRVADDPGSSVLVVPCIRARETVLSLFVAPLPHGFDVFQPEQRSMLGLLPTAASLLSYAKTAPHARERV
jgi:hypothetical protein